MASPLRAILFDEPAYKTVWHDTYAPLRRELAGMWMSLEESLRYELCFDADGGFRMTTYNEHTVSYSGRYTVVAHAGSHYIALETEDSEVRVLRIEDLDPWQIRLKWLDEEQDVVLLSRRRVAPINGA